MGVVGSSPTLTTSQQEFILDWKQYQKEALKTWWQVDTNHPVIYPVLGLVNEAGEFAGKIKKIFRDKNGVISDEDKKEIKSELGDVLWYLTTICSEVGISLEDVANYNIEKLRDRQRRGVIGGNGDKR